MKNIRLHHPFSNNMTAVSNYFIDYYMPQAGGEYVKLYLCLLRHAADYGSIPLESIAELLIIPSGISTAACSTGQTRD